MHSDHPLIPREAALLAEATERIRAELVASLRSSLLEHGGLTLGPRTEAALHAVQRALEVWELQPALTVLAGVRLGEGLLRSLERAAPPRGQRLDTAARIDAAWRAIEEALSPLVRCLLAAHDDLPIDDTAEAVAGEVLRKLSSPGLAATLAYLAASRQASALLAEFEAVGGIGGGR